MCIRDRVKPGLSERFARLREIGIKTIMCTGDNPLTAATIAREAGVDGFIAECRPEDKIEAIKKEQAEGKLVAMTGDGTNDAPALAQADVGLAMNSGTQAAKEAANMVDLDSDPTKILEAVSYTHLHDRKDGKKPLFGRQGAVIFGAMAIIFLIGLAVCFSAERAGNPVVGSMGLSQDMGSMEGKETRFGMEPVSYTHLHSGWCVSCLPFLILPFLFLGTKKLL